jgi:hypothetical protein
MRILLMSLLLVGCASAMTPEEQKYVQYCASQRLHAARVDGNEIVTVHASIKELFKVKE